MKNNYVVFVDDEQDMHILFKQLLKKPGKEKGFFIECFANGKDCYSFVEENIEDINIILIISDIKMPIMDGIELLEKLTKNYPSLKVVMASAYSDAQTIKKVEELGAIRFLKKPIDFNIILQEIEDNMTNLA